MAQPVRTATGQPYGAAKQQADAQRTVPLPDASTWEAPIVPLHAPSMRPGEHVMSGVNDGPGPSAAEAGVIGAQNDTSHSGILNTLRGIYQAYPLPEIADAIRDYAANPPWRLEDLALNIVDDAEHTRALVSMGGYSLAFGAQRAMDPLPPQKGFFDPAAKLDPSQVNDQRNAGRLKGLAAAATSAATATTSAATEALPPGDGGEPDEQTNTTADMFTDNPKLRMKGPR